MNAVKPLLCLVGLVALGLVVAGCGSGKKVGSLSFTAPTTTTVSNVNTGTSVRCQHAGAEVPAPGKGVAASSDWGSGAAQLQLTRRQDGTLLVSCASTQKGDASPPATNRREARLTYPEVGVTMTAAPPGYRASVSRREVLNLFGQSGHGSLAKGTPTVRLWTVSGGRSARSGYPAWVLTFHHTRPTSYGVESVPQRPNCVFVAVYNLGGRVWTWFFQICPDRMPSRPNCDYGCTPANQPALDAAASAAQRVAGQKYYAGVVVNDPANTVTVYLAHAPRSILHRLSATHPGSYVIHNDAPRSLRAVKRLMRSFDPNALKAQGITVSGYGPTQDGYLQVGITSHVAEAQAKLNALYGPNIIHVVKQALAVADSAVG